jgi:hypothetical protein
MGLDSLMALSLVNQQQWVLCIACANEAQNPKNGDVPDMFLSLKFHTRATLGVFGLECPRMCQKKICSRSQFGDFLEWGYPQIIHKHLFWGTPIYGTTIWRSKNLGFNRRAR